MISKLFFPLAIFLITSSLYELQAQDNQKDPRAASAIPVSMEPRHHLIFENKWIRILDVHIAPGDTTLFHRHATPSVFVVLSNTKTGSEVIVEPRKPHFTVGNTWFEGFYDTPRIHRVWNRDTCEFHVMDIELPNRDNKQFDATMPQTVGDSAVLLFDEKQVRVYRLTLRPNSHTLMKTMPMPVAIISLNDTKGKLTANGNPLNRKGDFAFIDAGSPLDFFNHQKMATELLILNLKFFRLRISNSVAIFW